MDPSTSTKADKEWGWANNLAPHTHMIHVLNKKTYNHATASIWIDPERIIYVGRPSTLGNPFYHEHAVAGWMDEYNIYISTVKVGTREEACKRFKKYINRQVEMYHILPDALECRQWRKILKIAARVKAAPNEAWGIMCWCAPEACHADAIKEAIEWAIKKGLV